MSLLSPFRPLRHKFSKRSLSIPRQVLLDHDVVAQTNRPNSPHHPCSHESSARNLLCGSSTRLYQYDRRLFCWFSRQCHQINWYKPLHPFSMLSLIVYRSWGLGHWLVSACLCIQKEQSAISINNPNENWLCVGDWHLLGMARGTDSIRV